MRHIIPNQYGDINSVIDQVARIRGIDRTRLLYLLLKCLLTGTEEEVSELVNELIDTLNFGPRVIT